MLKELIDFVDASFPCIPYGEKEKAKEAIQQFEKTGKTVNYLLNKPLQDISQGDILYNIPFVYFDDNGELRRFNAKAMILNTSCHIENHNSITLVPVLPIDSAEFLNSSDCSVITNQIYDLMYIPDDRLSKYYIDFSMPVAYSADLIKTQIEKGIIHRFASLSQIGYYLFLIKLNIYLMRREDPITFRQRNDEK